MKGLIVCLMLLALSGSTQAVCMDVYPESRTCEGTSTKQCIDSGKCLEQNGASGTIECASKSADSSWTYKVYFGSTDCTGTPVTTTGTGKTCTEISLGGGNAFGGVVDCSAGSSFVTSSVTLVAVFIICFFGF
eukprot:m.330927 g.330927  ORF g.330927 m.330927 type:complete len:133 (+) comp16609_c0_seq1:46-444(+)